MKHLNEPPAPIFGISPDLQAVINRTLAKDEKLRYANAAEMTNELTAVFNGKTISKSTADIAKAEAVTSKNKEMRPFNWGWAGLGALVIFGLAFIVFQLLFSPSVDEGQVVGRVIYSDQNALLDKATVTLSDLPTPKAGTHFEVWYLAGGGEVRRNVGVIKMDDSAQGQLVYTNLEQQNILSLFDQLEVTIEPDNDPNPDEASSDVVASSVFPPLALVHVRHILGSFPTAPEQGALIQGLWYSSEWVYTNSVDIQNAFSNGDEQPFRIKNEELINMIVGNANKNQYIDWNQDGTINDPSDGYGMLQNGDPGYNDQGYISQTISHAQFAAQAVDSTENIKLQSANLLFCLENMNGWSEQLLEKALQLQSMPFGADMEPLIKEITALSDQIISGVDSNGNDLIEPIIGEGGATTAYEYAYYLAEMPLLPGAHRIPPPAPTQGE